MTILKILEIHHLTQLYKGKARNDCGLYSGQGKLLQGKLIFRKTYLPENFLVKAYFPENFFSAASITLLILV